MNRLPAPPSFLTSTLAVLSTVAVGALVVLFVVLLGDGEPFDLF